MMLNRKRVFILGAGIMQIPGIKIARSRNWYTIVADANPLAPGAALGDCFEKVDLKDRETMLQRARYHKEKDGLDGVFTAGTDFSATVAYVAENLGLPGISYETALRASDKYLMRRTFKARGVPSPEYHLVSREEDLEPLISRLAFPLVIKPVDNMGARGVKKILTSQELRSALPVSLGYSRSHRVVLEEFMEGPEYSIDALVYNGKVDICGVAERHIFYPPYFIEMGHTMPAARVPEELIQVFEAGVRALGIDNGAAKGDMKMTPKGPMVGEIAARLSGGFMSGWTYPLASGREVTAGALNIALGLPPGLPRVDAGRCSAERACISIPGVISEVRGEENVRQIPGVKELFLLVKPGDRVVFPRNNVEKCGNVISCSPDREQAVSAAGAGVKGLSLLLEPGCLETDKFLFYPGKEQKYGAFELSARGNIEAFKNMPIFIGDPGNFTDIFFLPLPEEEEGKDWNGHTLSESLEKVRAVTGISPGGEGEGHKLILGKLFWQSLLRGGYQGGIYVIHTLSVLPEIEDKGRSWLEKCSVNM